ncbi:MAG: tetratricopeptide repeat protein [Verrucomicrobiota bacterium]
MKRDGNHWLGFALAGGVLALSSTTVAAQALQAAQALFLEGDYPACLKACAENTQLQEDFPAFAALEVRTLLETGKYKEAVARGTGLWRRSQFDPELSLELADALRANGQASQARSVVRQALQIQPDPPVAGQSRATVAYGELVLTEQVDAKEVLKGILDPAKKADPAGRAAYLAIGRLALAHHDRELAAENFREGLKRFPGDPEFSLGLEQAGVAPPRELQDPDDGISSYLDLALRANPKFTEALLVRAEKLGGGRDSNGAKAALDQVLAVNPDHPEAWAQLAALALLGEDAEGAEKALKNARKFWKGNPRVSEIVGVTLAAHYRFAEAIVYLKQASEEDPESPSIHFELGSNQLRFGQLEEGWKNVALAHELDPYHVAAFNLITLRDKLQGFPVREKDGVRLRMSPEDMVVFGTRALELAARAKRTLAEKYQVKLSQPVMVEMLPKQEDFAIRTFGLPGGESFLGVCFGPLITTTSPRGRLGRANWEAVVWHEMAHAITLSASRHRIPRWLSEGISVYEERQVRPGWGQGMTSEYRERFLSGKVPPIAKLDESFAGPDIMLGYYHASLVAEFVVERFGIAAMRSILVDLSAGKSIEMALSKRTLPLPELETAFLDRAKKIAAAYGPDLDWSPLTDEEYVEYRKDPATWVAAHPKRYAAAMMWISKLTEEGKWPDAKTRIEALIAAEPNNREEFNPYHALSLACRGLGDEAGERTALKKLLEIDSNASEAAARLLQISGKVSAPERLADGQRMLETNPFQEQAYRTLIAAAKETGAPASDAYLSLLALETLDAGRLRIELAKILRDSDRDESRRQVLKALEDNPRFEAALEFLVQLTKSP